MNRPVFVFESNLAGRHGKGAALFAAKEYGAERGVGEGMTGHAYAIPTKDMNLRTRSEDEVWKSIRKFLLFASTDGCGMWFNLTPIGCRLAGMHASDVMDIIKSEGLPWNVLLSPRWITDHNIMGEGK